MASTTVTCNPAATTPSGVVAYYRDHGCSPEDIRYKLTRDVDLIMDLPADDLAFLAPDIKRAEVFEEIQARHPGPHPLMTNVVHPRHVYNANLPDHVLLEPTYKYEGHDADEVFTIAVALGEPVPVTSEWASKSWNYERKMQWPALQDDLHDTGCYLRKTDEGYFVLYDPKIAARRAARGTHGGRVTPYVTCAELNNWAKAMEVWNSKIVREPSITVGWVWRRHDVLHALRGMSALFELLYGHNAFWQLEEFRVLVKTWKTKGPATWRAFERTIYHSADYKLIFTILDEAAELKRQPRKRELRARLPKGYRWKRP